jgi:F-box and WD-40 domain protein CDC4
MGYRGSVGKCQLLHSTETLNQDIPDRKAIQTLHGHSATVRALHIFSEGNRLVSGSKDSTLRIWNLESGVCEQVLKGHTGSVWRVDMFDHYIISGSTDGDARIWDASNWGELHVLAGHSGAIFAVAIDADRSYTSAQDGTTRIWNNITGYV